jgi:steroid delta-isomerase-like uncharacterized protein
MNTGNTNVKTKETKEKSLGQQIIDAWNTRTDEKIFPFYTKDYVVEDITASRIREGWDGLRQWTTSVFTAFPNLQYTLVDHVENEGKLVLHWLAKGNHQGPLMKIPATGKNVFIHGMSILTLEDGKVKHGQVMWDMAGVLRQIGLLPEINHH